MSLCDDRGLFATDKEMARRRSRSCVEGDELISVSLKVFNLSSSLLLIFVLYHIPRKMQIYKTVKF